MRLDTHQHFWKLANPFTDWPTPDLAEIHRDFGPEDLRGLLVQRGIDGTILVQAAPSTAETEYCLALAGTCDFVKGVVGWIDFEDDDPVDRLRCLARNPAFKGLRPMVQSIAEPGWLLRPEFGPIYAELIARDLTLDGLVLAHQIDDLDRLAQRHPKLRIVLDHAGKPSIASRAFDGWANSITRLAANANVHCKLSGLWTEAGDDRSLDALAPWVDHLVVSFGTARLMWGSDWPVITLVGRYEDWLSQSENFCAPLNADERAAIFGGNGMRFYGVT